MHGALRIEISLHWWVPEYFFFSLFHITMPIFMFSCEQMNSEGWGLSVYSFSVSFNLFLIRCFINVINYSQWEHLKCWECLRKEIKIKKNISIGNAHKPHNKPKFDIKIAWFVICEPRVMWLCLQQTSMFFYEGLVHISGSCSRHTCNGFFSRPNYSLCFAWILHRYLQPYCQWQFLCRSTTIVQFKSGP